MIILTEFQCKVLAKLKRDSAMTYEEMEAHWGNLGGLKELVDEGYIHITSGIVSINAKGRAHDVALNLQRLNAIDPKSAPVADSAQPEKFSWVDKALHYIEQHPNQAMNMIKKGIGNLAFGKDFLNAYIKRDQVIVTVKKGSWPTYQLAPGWTAEKIIATRYQRGPVAIKPAIEVPVFLDNKKPAKSKATVKPIKPVPVIEQAQTLIAAAEAPTPTDDQVAATLALFPTLVSAPPSTRGDFRCAYTNDGCLMLLGLQCLPIELNVAQTNDLVEFISEQIMPIGVAL